MREGASTGRRRESGRVDSRPPRLKIALLVVSTTGKEWQSEGYEKVDKPTVLAYAQGLEVGSAWRRE